MGRGMQMLCKTFGAIDFNVGGEKVRYVWDYHTDEAVKESEMTPERKKLSDIAKAEIMKKGLEQLKNNRNV